MKLGYGGIFFLSFIGSIIPFLPTPFYIGITLISLDTNFDLTGIVLAGGLGSAMAKTLIFRLSYLGQRFIKGERERRMAPLRKLTLRYGWIAIFVVAITPIPDDMVYVPLGIAKYSLKRFLVAIVVGKLLLVGAISLGSRFLGSPYVKPIMEGAYDSPTLVLLTSITFLIFGTIIYGMVRVDWGKVLGKWFPWTIDDR